MVIDQLEVQACAGLDLDAGAGTGANAEAIVGGRQVKVVFRVDRRGQRVFTYYCDGARMPRPILAMLLCSEEACARGQQVKSRWRDFNGEPSPRLRRPVQKLEVRPLMEEVTVESAGHRCTVRPASFECLTACPAGAHGPEVMRKAGWDLFEDGVWMAGGLSKELQSGCSEPAFKTPSDAAQWLSDQQAKANTLLQQVR